MKTLDWLLSLLFRRQAEDTAAHVEDEGMPYDYLIEALQRLLAAAGHDPGPIDGLRGPKTEAATRAYLAKVAPPPVIPSAGWDARSARSLAGVHPDLVRVAERARQLSPRPFVVIEGLRSLAQQKANVAKGVSQTMNSRHLTGHAIDAVPLDDKGAISWDWKYYTPLAGAFKTAAQELGIPIVWGGDWKTFKDGPHYELDRNRYSA